MHNVSTDLKRAVLLLPGEEVFPFPVSRLGHIAEAVGGSVKMTCQHGLVFYSNRNPEDLPPTQQFINQLASDLLNKKVIGPVLVMGQNGETPTGRSLTVEEAGIFLTPEGADRLNEMTGGRTVGV